MSRFACTLLWSIVVFLANAQTPVFTGTSFTPSNPDGLDQQFGEFFVFRIDPVSLNAYAKQAEGDRSFRLKLGDSFDWLMEIHARDIRSPHYSIQVLTDYGIEPMAVEENKTFRGHLQHPPGGVVSLTLDHDFIYGFVADGDELFFIEPLRYFIPGSDADLFVVYPSSKVIPVEGKTCGAIEMFDHKVEWKTEDQPETGNCLRVELAIAADWSMRDKYGSNAGVINHTTGVMNNVQTNYDNEFADELSFFIVEHFISSCSTCDPWTSSTDAIELLESFTNWGPTGFSNTHDIGQLWTNRDLNGSTIGIAWVGTVCTNYRYHVLQDFSTNADFLRVLTGYFCPNPQKPTLRHTLLQILPRIGFILT